MPRPAEWYHFRDANQFSVSPKERFQAAQMGGRLLDRWHEEVTHAWHRVLVVDWQTNYHAMQHWLEQRVGLDHFNCIFGHSGLTFDIEDAEAAMLFKLTWC